MFDLHMHGRTLSSRPNGRLGERRGVSTWTEALKFAAANAITIPYYRFFRKNTLLPILTIARSLQSGLFDREEIYTRTRHWRQRKLNEFQFVQLAVSLPGLHPFRVDYLTILEHTSVRRCDRMFLMAYSRLAALAWSSILVFQSLVVSLRVAIVFFRVLHFLHDTGLSTDNNPRRRVRYDFTCRRTR